MSVTKDIEADSLFQLLAPVGSPELNVRDVSNLFQKLDSLGTPKPLENEEKEEKAEEADKAEKTEKIERVIEVQPVVFQRPPAKRRSFITATSTPLRERVLKKVTPEEFRARKMVPAPVYAQTMQNIEKSSESRTATPKRQIRTPPSPSFELEYFPNKKKSIGLDEFSDLCNDALVNQPIQDDILMKCFSVFDYNKKGYIESKVIKEIFMMFNEQVSEQDIETLLKFLGCSDDGMTFDELKMFFKNNL